MPQLLGPSLPQTFQRGLCIALPLARSSWSATGTQNEGLRRTIDDAKRRENDRREAGDVAVDAMMTSPCTDASHQNVYADTATTLLTQCDFTTGHCGINDNQ